MSDEIKSNFKNLSIDKTSPPKNPEQKPDALEFDNNKNPAANPTSSTNVNDDFSMDMGPSNPNFRPAANKVTTNVPKKKMVMMRRTKDVIEKQELEVKKKATDEARARELQAKTIEQRQKEYQAVRERLGITGTPSTESESGGNAQNQAQNPALSGSGNEIGVAVAPESAVPEVVAATREGEEEESAAAEVKEENQSETAGKAGTDKKGTDNTGTHKNTPKTDTETCKTRQETTKTDPKIEPTPKDTTPKSIVCSSQEAPLPGVTTADSGEAAVVAAGDEAVQEAAELDKLIEQQTAMDSDNNSDKNSQKDSKQDSQKNVTSENEAEKTEKSETKTADSIKSDSKSEETKKTSSSNDQTPYKLPEKTHQARGRGTGILSRGNHHISKPAVFVNRNTQRPEGKGLLPLPAFVVNQGNNASLAQNNPSNQYPNYYQSGGPTNQPGLVQNPNVMNNLGQNLGQNPGQNPGQQTPVNNQAGIQQQFSNWKQPEFAPTQNRGDYGGGNRGTYQNRGGRGGVNNGGPRSPNPASAQQWNNGSNQPRPNFQNRGGYQGNQRGGVGQQPRGGRGGYNNYNPRSFTPQNFQNAQNFGNSNISPNRHNSNRGGLNQNSGYNPGHQGQHGNQAQNNRHNNQVHNSVHNNNSNHQNGHNQANAHVHPNQQMNQQHRGGSGGNNAVHSQPPQVHNSHNQNHGQSNNPAGGAHVASNGHQNPQNQFRQFEMPGQPAQAQPQSFNPPPHQFNGNYYQPPNMSAQGARGDATGAGQFGNFGPPTPPQFQNTTFIPAAQNFQVPSTQYQINSNAMRPVIGATDWGQPPIPSTTVANGNMQATTMANPPQLSPNHPSSAQPGTNMNLFQNNNMATMS